MGTSNVNRPICRCGIEDNALLCPGDALERATEICFLIPCDDHDGEAHGRVRITLLISCSKRKNPKRPCCFGFCLSLLLVELFRNLLCEGCRSRILRSPLGDLLLLRWGGVVARRYIRYHRLLGYDAIECVLENDSIANQGVSSYA